MRIFKSNVRLESKLTCIEDQIESNESWIRDIATYLITTYFILIKPLCDRLRMSVLISWKRPLPSGHKIVFHQRIKAFTQNYAIDFVMPKTMPASKTPA